MEGGVSFTSGIEYSLTNKEDQKIINFFGPVDREDSGCPGGPYQLYIQLDDYPYVIEIDSNKNEIIVGPKEKLGKKIIHLKELNLLADKKDFVNSVFVKVRSTGKLLDAKINFSKQDCAEVNLELPEDGLSLIHI